VRQERRRESRRMLTTIRPYNPGSPGGVNVCTLTVRLDLRVGCGVCVPVCPTSTLSMAFNTNGELFPEDAGNCRRGCHVGVDACPFLDHAGREDSLARTLFALHPGVGHRIETGYVRGPLRARSTSGGGYGIKARGAGRDIFDHEDFCLGASDMLSDIIAARMSSLLRQSLESGGAELPS
jgi:ferredoxin